jgi:hypothetical protein
MSTTVHSTPFTRYFVDSCDESFGLPDGDSVTTYRAYDALYEGPFRRPVGPLFGRVTEREVREWMAENHPTAVEVESMVAA